MDSKTYTEFGYRGAEEILLLNKVFSFVYQKLIL